jgi:hypothetical protein
VRRRRLTWRRRLRTAGVSEFPRSYDPLSSDTPLGLCQVSVARVTEGWIEVGNAESPPAGSTGHGRIFAPVIAFRSI